MRISAVLHPLSVREVRAKLVQDIAFTVQVFALLGFVFSTIGIAVAPQLRVTMEFCLLGICFVSAVVLLANNLRQEAGTAFWCGAVISSLVACDIVDATGRVLMFGLCFLCLWLMWYVTPTSVSDTE